MSQAYDSPDKSGFLRIAPPTRRTFHPIAILCDVRARERLEDHMKTKTQAFFATMVLAAFAAIVLATFAVTSQARAVTYPFQIHQEQNIDSHQVGWIDLAIDPSGKGSLTAGFSNGKQWAGNNFYAITALRGKDGAVIWATIQEKGLDGSGMGHAREGRVTTNFALTKEQLDNFDHVELVKVGVRNCGMRVIEMHNLNDWTFATKPCEVPDTPKTAPARPSRIVR
jgi:hypothetical protein